MRSFTILMVLWILLPGLAAAEQIGPAPVGNEKSLSGDFSQKRFLTGFEEPFVTTGRFYLLPKTGLAWIVQSPFVSQLIMTDHNIVQVVNGVTVQMDGGDRVAKVIMNMIHPVLVGDWNLLQQEFDITEQLRDEKTQGWRVVLTPKQDVMKTTIKQLVVTGHDKTEALTILKPNGDRDEIQFSSQQVFDEPPAQALKLFQGSEVK